MADCLLDSTISSWAGLAAIFGWLGDGVGLELGACAAGGVARAVCSPLAFAVLPSCRRKQTGQQAVRIMQLAACMMASYDAPIKYLAAMKYISVHAQSHIGLL